MPISLPRFAASAMSACLAGGAHVLALVALLDTTPRERLQLDRIFAGVAAPDRGYSIEPFTLVELDETPRTETVWPEPPALASFRLSGELRLTLPPVEVLESAEGEVEAIDDTALSTVPVAMEGQDRPELFAKYIAQIRARIERAWERPPDELPGDRAGCLAYVTQDTSGRVIDIDLSNCAARPEWRHSLLTAIRRASPFPAPADAQVFAKRISLQLGEKS